MAVLDVLANSNGVGTKFISGNVGMNIIPVFPATFQGITCAAKQNKNGRLQSVLCNHPWEEPSVFYPPQVSILSLCSGVFVNEVKVKT